MPIFYYYLSSKDVATCTLSSSSPSLLLNHQQKHGSSWSSQVYSILKPNSSKRMDTLMASSVGSYDIISSTIYLMIHYETIWWIHANINEYKETQQQTLFVFPARGRRIFSLIQQLFYQNHHNNPSSLLLVRQEMKQYLIEFGNRILPSVLIDHQLSMLVMYLIQKLILPIIFATKEEETCLKLTQHPFYTSKSIMYGNDDGSSSFALSSSSSSSVGGGGGAGGGLVGNSSSSSSPPRTTTTPDRITASMEIIAVSLWSNGLFFISQYIVNRLRAIYQIKKRQWDRQRQQQQQQRLQRQTSRTINASGREVVVIVVDDDDDDDNDHVDDQETTEHNNNNSNDNNDDTTTIDILSMDRYWNMSLGSFWLSSWDLFKQSWQRYIYSAFGSGIGSMIFGAGWGTLIGLGIGDAYASTILLHQSSSSSPTTSTTTDGNEEGRSSSRTSTTTTDYHHHPIIRTVSSLLDQLVVSPKKKSNVDNNNNKSHNDESTTTSKKDELLTCGCCQIVTFSSHNSNSNNSNNNNNNSKRLPVSSRVCDHTICKGCVEQCQIALMERTSNYEEWIKCPLCNAPKAYNCYDHLINRSLCNAIALIEENEEEGKNKDGNNNNNNNAGNKKDS